MEPVSSTAEEFDDFCGPRPISGAQFIEPAGEFA
jgi:hypothetical protein